MGAPIRPHILRLRPYVQGKPSVISPGSDIVKLASNENPLGPSPRAVEAMARAAERAHQYPDGGGTLLREELSQRFDLPAGQILLGNGSDELLRMIGAVVLESPEDEVVCATPTFLVYEHTAHVVPATLKQAPLTDDFRHDLPAMAALIGPQTKIVFLANPHNPTGTVVTRGEFERFLERIPATVWVVLDEAYFEFLRDNADSPTSLDYVRQGRPVVGLRTFSKAYGLAGARCGYGFFPRDLADAIERARQPFNVNALAQAGCLAALRDHEFLDRTLANNRSGMRRIEECVRRLGGQVSDSHANFVFADFGRPTADLVSALEAKSIYVRGGAGLGCPNAMRITVGTPEEVERFCAAIEDCAVLGGAR